MKIESKGLKEAEQSIKNIIDGLNSIPKEMEEEVIVKDSQFTKGNNFVDTSKLSDTAEEARHEARYVAARLQQPFDESNIPPEEVEDAEEEIVNRFLRDYLDNMFRG